MPDNTRTESPSPAPPKKSFAQYLIDTDIGALAFLGKSIQYFGPKEVTAFLMGALAVYGYSFYRPLPFLKQLPASPTPPAPAAASLVKLHGSVRTLQNKPLTDFQVAVVRNAVSPVTSAVGAFTIEVPLQDTYSLVVWAPGYSPMKFYGDLPVETVDNQYQVDVPAFPEAQQ